MRLLRLPDCHKHACSEHDACDAYAQSIRRVDEHI